MLLMFTQGLLLLSLLILLILFFKDTQIRHKLLYLNLMTLKLALLMTLIAVFTHSQILLDLSMTYSIIGFFSMSILLRFLLKGGRLK